VANPEAVVKIFRIQYGNARSLVAMLREMFPSNIAGTPGAQFPGNTGEDALIPISFGVDVRTNSIIAAGSPGDMIAVEAMLMTLDTEDALSRTQKVYPLRSMRAVNVAATINEYIRSRREIQQAAPGVTSEYSQIESEVIVVADVESNSLIIDATPKFMDEIIKLVNEIDKSPPQVNIQVLIAEILLSETDEWSSEIGLQDPLMFTRGSNAPGLLFNRNPVNSLGSGTDSPNTIGTQILSNFGGQRVGTTGFGGLVVSASSDYINVTLRALHEKKRLEVLNSTNITAMNNQQSIISVGQSIPRYAGREDSNFGSRDIIVDIPVELRLQLRPTISPDGTVMMIVEARNEKVGTMMQVSQGNSSPQIDRTMVSTMISAANNETVVLGGLISKTDDKVRRKIPLLGDVPLLGKAFRQDINQTRRTELLIILTPRIVQDRDDAERVRQMNVARMSWCLSNVVQTFGDMGSYSVVSEKPDTGDAPVVTPPPVKLRDLQPLE
jgi:type II secretory pathway component GspD/PulD (secretin)